MGNQQKKRRPDARSSPRARLRARLCLCALRGSIKAVEAAAKAKNQTVSEWVRSTIDAALGV